MKSLLFFFLIAFSLNLNAQNGVYQTYQDYKADKLLKMDAYEAFTQTGKIVFKKDKKKEKFDLGEVWGFMVNGELYRGQKESGLAPGVAYKVISNGKIVYYENGQAYLTALENKKGDGYYEGWFFFVSKDMDSHIVQLGKGTKNKVKKEIPNAEPLLDCIEEIRNGENDWILKYRACVEQFQQ